MQSLKKVNLSKLRKCDQVWADMPVNDRGRVCNKCQNTIIDFRKLSDQEIAETHVFSEGKVCGLYLPEQLAPKIKLPKSNKFKSLYFALLTLFFSMGTKGQGKTETVKIEQIEPPFEKQNVSRQDSSSNKFQVKDSLLVTGYIRDESDGELPFASVHIKGTKVGVSADVNGYYVLNIFDELKLADQITLVYQFIGYRSQEIVFLATDQKGDLIELNLSLMEAETDIIEFSISERPPLHKRVWRKFVRLFR